MLINNDILLAIILVPLILLMTILTIVLSAYVLYVLFFKNHTFYYVEYSNNSNKIKNRIFSYLSRRKFHCDKNIWSKKSIVYPRFIEINNKNNKLYLKAWWHHPQIKGSTYNPEINLLIWDQMLLKRDINNIEEIILGK